MNKVLYLKNVNETSRFYFGIKINIKTLLNLVKEFSDSSLDLVDASFMSKKLSFKIINRSNKKSIEINTEYIAFYPLITEEQEINEIRERIYKHVAKKSDVYQRTAKENEISATSSIVTGELRATASLLYYCFHKFINSRMFFYFNDVLGLDDHDIEILELKHFTSSEYNQFINKQATIVEISNNNYLKVLNKRVKPFLLLRYILKENLDSLKNIFLPYILFISKKLFAENLDDTNKIIDVLEKRINEFNSLKTKPGQETEVEVAIAVALKNYLESTEDSNKSIWLLDIISLRLYLLRQTADYAYDFEVKTSTREMSLLLNTIQSLINYIINTQENDQVKHNESIGLQNKLHADKGSEYLSAVNNNEQPINKSKTVKFYNVNIKFPEEIKQEQSEIITYMTAVHLDSNFDKNKLMQLLNLSSNIRNQGKNFIFENSNPLSKYLYAYIDEGGRWTVWFVKDTESSHLLTSSDLINSFEELIDTLIENCQTFFGETVKWSLVSSYPVYKSNFSKLTTSTILSTMESIKYKEKVLQANVAKQISKHLGLPRNSNKITLNGINVIIKVFLSSEQDSLGIPLTTLITAKYNDKHDKQLNTAFLSLIINDTNEFLTKNVNFLNAVYNAFEKDLGFKNILRGNQIIDINSKQIDDLIFKSDRDSKVFEGFAKLLNQIAYKMINGGKVNDNVKHLINKSIEAFPLYSFSYATLGMWYFRNNEIDINESMDKGIEYYNKALEIEKTERNNESTKDMQQKFLYEQSVFLLFRKRNYKEALNLINEGIEIGEGDFYEDLIELKAKIDSVIKPLKQVSVTKSSTMLSKRKLIKRRGTTKIISKKISTSVRRGKVQARPSLKNPKRKRNIKRANI